MSAPIVASKCPVDIIDAGWSDVLDLLPPDLGRMAKEEFGFRRRGAIRSAADVVRIAAESQRLGR